MFGDLDLDVDRPPLPLRLPGPGLVTISTESTRTVSLTVTLRPRAPVPELVFERHRKRGPIQKLKEQCDKLERILHWPRVAKHDGDQEARPPSPPTSPVDAVSAAGSKVIGGPKAIEVITGASRVTLHQGEAETTEPPLGVLDRGPVQRPCAVGAPLGQEHRVDARVGGWGESRRTSDGHRSGAPMPGATSGAGAGAAPGTAGATGPVAERTETRRGGSHQVADRAPRPAEHVPVGKEVSHPLADNLLGPRDNDKVKREDFPGASGASKELQRTLATHRAPSHSAGIDQEGAGLRPAERVRSAAAEAVPVVTEPKQGADVEVPKRGRPVPPSLQITEVTDDAKRGEREEGDGPPRVTTLTTYPASSASTRITEKTQCQQPAGELSQELLRSARTLPTDSNPETLPAPELNARASKASPGHRERQPDSRDKERDDKVSRDEMKSSLAPSREGGGVQSSEPREEGLKSAQRVAGIEDLRRLSKAEKESVPVRDVHVQSAQEARPRGPRARSTSPNTRPRTQVAPSRSSSGAGGGGAGARKPPQPAGSVATKQQPKPPSSREGRPRRAEESATKDKRTSLEAEAAKVRSKERCSCCRVGVDRTKSVSPSPARRRTATAVLPGLESRAPARSSHPLVLSSSAPSSPSSSGACRIALVGQTLPAVPAPPRDVLALELEIQELRVQLSERRAEELRLRREIHKLRSVLQQATSFSGDGDAERADGEPEADAEAPLETQDALLTSLQARHTMAGAEGRAATSNKKQGVSGESSGSGGSHSSPHPPLPLAQRTFPKDFRSQHLITAAILDNDFLKNLARSQIRDLVDCMYPEHIAQGSYVVREGEAGSHLYVLSEGEMEVLKEGTVLGRMGPGKAFGELAILYNCTRTASIRAVTDLQVWVLDRKVFQQIMMRTGIRRMEENLSFLRSVPLLKNLSQSTLIKIADVLEVEFYPAGSYIVRQGASGNTFFMICDGSVQVTQRLPGATEQVVIRTLERGDYFGEQALLRDDCRTASVLALPPGVECLTLDRESFLTLIGPLSELQQKDYGDDNRQLPRSSSTCSVHSDTSLDCEVEALRLSDLQVVGTLGTGGFGSVRLAVAGARSFALKCLNKNHIVATGQQEHVIAERDLLLSIHCPFIIRLYRTFRDDHFVYLLLEACLGGELWALLQSQGCLDAGQARFAVGCAMEALEYLHARSIVYRDLKPENLVLDARGYIKLVDFGFSKRLVSNSKTWTFCGTPDYVAPEVVLNRGHDQAVDNWALGILIFELLTGTPPFSAADPMHTYNLILKGMDAVVMPHSVGRPAANLMRRLCRDAPGERLSLQAARQHKWFQGFDWEGLRLQTMPSPIETKVSGPADLSNFDAIARDDEQPCQEQSRWEADF